MIESNNVGLALALGFYAKHCEAMDEFASAADPPGDAEDDEWRKALTEEVGPELARVFELHKDNLNKIYSAAQEAALHVLRAAKAALESALPRLGLSLANGTIRVSRQYWQVTAAVRPRQPGRPKERCLGFRAFIAVIERELSAGLSLVVGGPSTNERRLRRELAKKGWKLPEGIDADLEHGEVLLWSRPLQSGIATNSVEPVELNTVVHELKAGLNSLQPELFRDVFIALKQEP